MLGFVCYFLKKKKKEETFSIFLFFFFWKGERDSSMPKCLGNREREEGREEERAPRNQRPEATTERANESCGIRVFN